MIVVIITITIVRLPNPLADDPVYHHHHLVDGDKEVLGRPYPEHAEVGEHHQVEESQLEEVWEAAMVLIKWGVLLMTSRLFVGATLVIHLLGQYTFQEKLELISGERRRDNPCLCTSSCSPPPLQQTGSISSCE